MSARLYLASRAWPLIAILGLLLVITGLHGLLSRPPDGMPQLLAPNSIAVDSSGHFYVFDSYSSTVSQFSGSGALESRWHVPAGRGLALLNSRESGVDVATARTDLSLTYDAGGREVGRKDDPEAYLRFPHTTSAAHTGGGAVSIGEGLVSYRSPKGRAEAWSYKAGFPSGLVVLPYPLSALPILPGALTLVLAWGFRRQLVSAG